MKKKLKKFIEDLYLINGERLDNMCSNDYTPEAKKSLRHKYNNTLAIIKDLEKILN
jgi:hypothetical protein